MSARPNRLQRGLFWTGIPLGLLVLYNGSWPFVSFWCERNVRAALPVVRAAYAPLEVYCRKEWPGSGIYGQYTGRTLRVLNERMRGDASARLTDQTSLQFAGTPLRDVISYVSEIHDIHIELLEGVDGDVEVTLDSNATLRDALAGMLQPLGLAAAPIGRKVVVGSPETVQRLASEAEAAANASKLRGNLIELAGLVLFVALIVLAVRRRAARRGAVIDANTVH